MPTIKKLAFPTQLSIDSKSMFTCLRNERWWATWSPLSSGSCLPARSLRHYLLAPLTLQHCKTQISCDSFFVLSIYISFHVFMMRLDIWECDMELLLLTPGNDVSVCIASPELITSKAWCSNLLHTSHRLPVMFGFYTHTLHSSIVVTSKSFKLSASHNEMSRESA